MKFLTDRADYCLYSAFRMVLARHRSPIKRIFTKFQRKMSGGALPGDLADQSLGTYLVIHELRNISFTREQKARVIKGEISSYWKTAFAEHC